jgi:lysophospholipase L1-like esterase
VYPGYDARQVEIVTVGDSYTAGSEVDDPDAYPAQLAGALDVQVANQGVGGYGPAQSFLNLQAKIERYPAARIVILGIMYENVYRMVNSYRPVLYDKSETYGLKPYMSGGAIVPHPGAAALHDVATFRTHAIAAFEQDFWAKPKHRFPYSIALLRALSTNYYWFQRVQRPFPKIGAPEYFLAFRSPAIAGELRALLNQYATYAKSRGLRPVAVFIPRNRYDTQSASRFINANRELLDRDLVLADVGAADVAWDRFNLEEPDSNNICHPTPYGYRQIAEHVAAVLQDEGMVGPASPTSVGRADRDRRRPVTN